MIPRPKAVPGSGTAAAEAMRTDLTQRPIVKKFACLVSSVRVAGEGASQVPGVSSLVHGCSDIRVVVVLAINFFPLPQYHARLPMFEITSFIFSVSTKSFQIISTLAW